MSSENIFIRFCPRCNCEIRHNRKDNCNRAIKNNILCRKCSCTLMGLKQRGCNNPFYGKHHTQETKDKLKLVDRSYTQTQEFKDKSKHIGSDNGMFGTSNYNHWVKKYGVEKADELMAIHKKKLSIAFSGDKNPQYGKPAYHGGGGGYSGWYKNFYFRSIDELSFLIKYVDRFNLKCNSAETHQYKIPYLSIDNKPRNYFPDYIINDKYIVEIKPKNKIKWVSTIVKADAAKIFCNNHNLIYKIISPIRLSTDEIIQLYLNKQIKFIEHIDKKFQEKFKNKINKS